MCCAGEESIDSLARIASLQNAAAGVKNKGKDVGKPTGKEKASDTKAQSV